MIAFLFLLLVSSVFAITDQVEGRKDASKACTLALQQIIYVPETCGYTYLKRIAKTLQCSSALLWTAQNQSILSSFAATYNVTVFVADAFGNLSPYPAANPLYLPSFTTATLPGFTGTSIPAFAWTSTAQANLIGEGFMDLQAGGYLYYTFIVRSTDGRLMYVNVGMNKFNIPFFC